MTAELNTPADGESVNDAFQREMAADMTAAGGPTGYTMTFLRGINVDDVVTQILENNLLEISELRRDLERANLKSIFDVRLRRATPVLEGFEGTITYEGLVDIIDELKDGIALRRVQLMQERLAALEGAPA